MWWSQAWRHKSDLVCSHQYLMVWKRIVSCDSSSLDRAHWCTHLVQLFVSQRNGNDFCKWLSLLKSHFSHSRFGHYQRRGKNNFRFSVWVLLVYWFDRFTNFRFIHWTLEKTVCGDIDANHLHDFLDKVQIYLFLCGKSCATTGIVHNSYCDFVGTFPTVLDGWSAIIKSIKLWKF